MEIHNQFINILDSCYDNDKMVDPRQFETVIKTPNDLVSCLPTVKERYDILKESIAACENNANNWTQSKNVWKTRLEDINNILLNCMQRLNIKKATDGVTKVSLSTKNTLEVMDSDILVRPWEEKVSEMTRDFPPYIKVSVSISKAELNKFVKDDSTLLINDPENIHYKETKSVSIK